MNRIAIAVAALAALSMPNLAGAASCRDAKGAFVKCPATSPASVPHASQSPRATPAHATAPRTTASSAPRCRDAKGHYAKCGTPGAKHA